MIKLYKNCLKNYQSVSHKISIFPNQITLSMNLNEYELCIAIYRKYVEFMLMFPETTNIPSDNISSIAKELSESIPLLKQIIGDDNDWRMFTKILYNFII